ncbi:hypothetical protein PIB30_027175 [Stylosanthes scabra]|uniref:Uncharacterized protein n=1 Tax=Stylosanthes scabra TaxID=79078 RepID=A0ABU6QAT9_9FABA|nr:hypothetical protein [Stylosanthes scabra]
MEIKGKGSLEEYTIEERNGKYMSGFGAKSRKRVNKDLGIYTRGIEVSSHGHMEGNRVIQRVCDGFRNGYATWHKGIGRLCLYIENNVSVPKTHSFIFSSLITILAFDTKHKFRNEHSLRSWIPLPNH